MVTLQYALPALSDLKAIYDYIARDSLLHAKMFVRAIKDRIKTLKNYPEMGMPVFPEKFSDLRQVFHKSYRIIYQYKADTVTIIPFHHQARMIDNIEAIKKHII